MAHYTHIHECILSYLSKEKTQTLFSSFMQEILSHSPTFLNSSPEFLNFDTLYDTVSTKSSTQNK